MRIFRFLLLLPIVVAASDHQELLVSDQGYYLNGQGAQDISRFDERINATDPIIVKACSCADTTRLVAVLDWLNEKGKKEVKVSTVTGDEQELCGVCH